MILSGIEIGSDTIKIIVCEKKENDINILASVDTKTVGITKGIISDKEMVIKSLKLALDEINKISPVKVDKCILNIPCYDVNVELISEEVYSEGKITGNDIINCFRNAIKNNIDPSREVISVFPIDFSVDGDKYYDPKGVEGFKLNGRLLISTVNKEYAISYMEVVSRCGVEVIDLSLGPISDYYAFKRDELNKCIGCVVNIGDSKTEISIFKKGLLLTSSILDMGSNLIDQDIKYAYDLDTNSAKKLKETFAYSKTEFADINETITFTTINNEKITINQKEISEIIESRLEVILKSVKKSISILTNKEISYIIITGGVSNILGFNSLMLETFGDKAYTKDINIIGLKDNIYSTCYGMIKYYIDKLQYRDINYTMYDNNIINNDNGYDVILNKMSSYIKDN